MVCHLPSTKKTVMLAYGDQTWIRHGFRPHFFSQNIRRLRARSPEAKGLSSLARAGHDIQLAVVTKVILWPDFLILDDCPYDIDSLIHMIIIRWWLLLLLLYTLLFYDYPYLSTILSSSMIIIYAVLALTPSINRLGCRWMLHAATTSPWTHPCLLTQCEHEQLRCHNVLKKWCT